MEEKKQRPQERYSKLNIIQFSLKLNKKTDMEIIAKLQATANKNGYIKELLKQDLEQTKK